jgi:hypothetical protein
VIADAHVRIVDAESAAAVRSMGTLGSTRRSGNLLPVQYATGGLVPSRRFGTEAEMKLLRFGGPAATWDFQQPKVQNRRVDRNGC